MLTALAGEVFIILVSETRFLMSFYFYLCFVVCVKPKQTEPKPTMANNVILLMLDCNLKEITQILVKYSAHLHSERQQ